MYVTGALSYYFVTESYLDTAASCSPDQQQGFVRLQVLGARIVTYCSLLALLKPAVAAF